MSEEVTLIDLIAYYEDVFVKAYADLVALTADKPAQVLVEIENFNSHLLVVLKNEIILPNQNPEIVSSNLRKAKTHLQRGTLDCYKMLFITINEHVLRFLKDLSLEDVQFALGDDYQKYITRWFEFTEKIQATRRLEVSSTGTDGLEDVIQEYKSAVEVGFSVYKQVLISAPKIAHVRKHLFWHSFKTHWPHHVAEITLAALITVILHSYIAG